jgi:hypothetical protein
MFADWTSLLGHALRLGANRPRPGIPCAVDRDGLEGKPYKSECALGSEAHSDFYDVARSSQPPLWSGAHWQALVKNLSEARTRRDPDW